jgi:crotonobetainyl-CoA:carnitine CoA-transferase CaiB-like acyl-CoA transferase
VKHSKLGDIPQLAPPIVLSETPACVRQPPPLLGEHSVEILAESGFTDDQISELVATGVVLTAS